MQVRQDIFYHVCWVAITARGARAGRMFRTVGCGLGASPPKTLVE